MLIIRVGCSVIFFLSAYLFFAGCGAEQKSVELGRIDNQEAGNQVNQVETEGKIDSDETSRFSVADPATPDSSVAATADSSKSDPSSITVPIGTTLHLVLQGEVRTTDFRAGYSFPAYFGEDLVIDGIVIARKGSRAEGKVAESKGGELFGVPRLILEITGLYFGEELIPVVTNRAGAEGDPMGGIRHMGAGSIAGKGSGDGKGFGTGKGQQITFPAGTAMTVKIMEPLILDKSLLPQQ